MLAEFARAGLREPQLVRLDTDTKLSPTLALAFLSVKAHEKVACLLHLVQEVIGGGRGGGGGGGPTESEAVRGGGSDGEAHISDVDGDGSGRQGEAASKHHQSRQQQQSIVFVSTKHHVELLSEVFQAARIPVSVVYGAMDQTARKIHIGRFRAGRTSLLIVTDVAARGLDIPLLNNVINFDFPPKPKLFVHRAGRAARVGRAGTAFSFLTPDELPYLLDLHLFLGRPIRAAPSDAEVVTSGGQALAAARLAEARGETVFGRYGPQSEVELFVERVRELERESVAVHSLMQVAARAYRHYLKSRPAASTESVRRAKSMSGDEGVHLLLRPRVGDLEERAAAMTHALRSFR